MCAPQIRPARAEYVEEQDAWRVSDSLRLSSLSSLQVDNARNFANTPVVVNETARALGLEEYSKVRAQDEILACWEQRRR
eukprot:756898-Hanusia_phi.AAC.5